jgi:Tfp pilus assembly protein PilF
MSKGFLTSQGVIVAALSLSLVGCGQFGKLKASKHFKDANALYAQQDYRGAAAEYKNAVEADPSLTKAYFFLANSYDNRTTRPSCSASARCSSWRRSTPRTS